MLSIRLALAASVALLLTSTALCAQQTVKTVEDVSPQTESPKERQGDVEEVFILGTRKASYTEITQDAQKLVEMPGAMGDPLGAITALPGVITPVDGSEPAVRGSSPDDNRYYIDGIPAGYIFHAFNTSVLDKNVVQDFQLFSAGFGAQYSGATGAVFDVRLRDPKSQDLTTTINASLLRAGIFVESRVSDNSSLYLSARTGLIQFFIPEGDEIDDEGIRIIDPPEDNDYLLKYVWDINDNNSLSVLFSGANDYIAAELSEAADFIHENPDFAGDAKYKQGFNSQGLTWKHSMDSGAESTLTLAKYRDIEDLEFGNNYYINSVLNNTIIRGNASFPLGDNHVLTLGGEYNNYNTDYDARLVIFLCTEFDVSCNDGRGEVVQQRHVLKIQDTTLYASDLWELSDTFNIEAGLQWNSNNFTDESFINPRLSAEWQAWNSVAVISSVGRYNRLPDPDTILPLIGNPNLQSPTADHFTIGLKGDLGENWDWILETYHKNLGNLPLSLDDDQPDSEKLYSNDVEGTAQGFDLFLNRNLSDKWYGWLALSYSKSDRTNIRNGDTRDYYLDTPLVLNMVGNYQFSQKWNAGFRFTAKSGQATTKIIGVKENPDFEGYYLPVYDEEPYGDRLPMFMQLNIRVERDIAWFGNEGSYYFDILNALNRNNVISTQLDYEEVQANGGELRTQDEAGMGIFPSIGVSFSF